MMPKLRFKLKPLSEIQKMETHSKYWCSNMNLFAGNWVTVTKIIYKTSRSYSLRETSSPKIYGMYGETKNEYYFLNDWIEKILPLES